MVGQRCVRSRPCPGRAISWFWFILQLQLAKTIKSFPHTCSCETAPFLPYTFILGFLVQCSFLHGSQVIFPQLYLAHHYYLSGILELILSAAVFTVFLNFVLIRHLLSLSFLYVHPIHWSKSEHLNRPESRAPQDSFEGFAQVWHSFPYYHLSPQILSWYSAQFCFLLSSAQSLLPVLLDGL